MVGFYDKGVSKAKYHCCCEFHASSVDKDLPNLLT